MEAYTIGLKRRLFGFRHYKVFRHLTETRVPAYPGDGVVDIVPRLVLYCDDNKIRVIPNIESREWFIGEDFTPPPEEENGLQSDS